MAGDGWGGGFVTGARHLEEEHELARAELRLERLQVGHRAREAVDEEGAVGLRHRLAQQADRRLRDDDLSLLDDLGNLLALG